ncbi:hypothetical protein ACFWDI_27555 [Streptomyces sp. NPDC060064]|uniref:hypothetical protein n=1 Tax=Streptomyces sp. NPDC060064 TaxID=3347049 RepID=UPI0036C1DBAA
MLDRLILTELPQFTDTSLLPRSASLRQLTVRDFEYLVTLDGLDRLAGLPSLEILSVEACPQLRTLGTGHGLPTLHSLFTSHCPELANLGSIADLPVLAELMLGNHSPNFNPDGLHSSAPFTMIRTHHDEDPRWQAAISQALGKTLRTANGRPEAVNEPPNACLSENPA